MMGPRPIFELTPPTHPATQTERSGERTMPAPSVAAIKWHLHHWECFGCHMENPANSGLNILGGFFTCNEEPGVVIGVAHILSALALLTFGGVLHTVFSGFPGLRVLDDSNVSSLKQ